MTLQIVIQVSNQPDVVIGVTEAAIKRARVSFNPSSLKNVDNIKALAAALYTLIDECSTDGEIGKLNWPSHALADVRNAQDHIQAGAMFAVSAATAHLS